MNSLYRVRKSKSSVILSPPCFSAPTFRSAFSCFFTVLTYKSEHTSAKLRYWALSAGYKLRKTA